MLKYLVTFLFTAALVPAFAQDFPSRRITIVVPYTAGGSSDFVARSAEVPAIDAVTGTNVGRDANTRNTARKTNRPASGNAGRAGLAR